MARKRGAQLLHAVLMVTAAALLLSSCRSNKSFQPYSAHENLLSIAAEFGLLSSVDPYRDDVGRDLTGQSIARSTLVRLANYESLHPGRLTPEVVTYKGRALELLGDYASAQRNYREAAEYDTELKEDCSRRAEALEKLLIAAGKPPTGLDLTSVIDHFAGQGSEYRLLARTFIDPLYQSLALREAENAEVRRAELMATNRFLLPDGEAQAIRALEELVANNRESRRALEHALRLARFRMELAEEEYRLNPPELSGFSIERFKTHYDAAVDLLYRISQADGRAERLVAKHELDALLALGETIEKRSR